jgi:hypothetical protein
MKQIRGTSRRRQVVNRRSISLVGFRGGPSNCPPSPASWHDCPLDPRYDGIVSTTYHHPCDNRACGGRRRRQPHTPWLQLRHRESSRRQPWWLARSRGARHYCPRSAVCRFSFSRGSRPASLRKRGTLPSSTSAHLVLPLLACFLTPGAGTLLANTRASPRLRLLSNPTGTAGSLNPTLRVSLLPVLTMSAYPCAIVS